MRRFLILIGGLVVALALGATSRPATSADKLAAVGQSAQPKAVSATPGPKADDPERLYAKCRKGEANRSSDLCAQWYAADSASEAAVWTRRTGIITALGLLVGAITMFAAIAAALFAKQAASHAEKGVAEAKRAADAAVISLQANRAWVVPSEIRRMDFKNGKYGDKKVNIGIQYVPTFINCGSTPAVNVVVGVQYRIVPIDDLHVPTFSVPDLGRDGVMLGPGVKLLASDVFLDDAESAEFRAQRAAIIVYAIAYYSDIHSDQRRYSSECNRITHNGGTEISEKGKREYISIIPVGRQNNAT